MIGTPGICDPGAELVAACVKENIPVHPVPGPSALTAALSICGFEGQIAFPLYFLTMSLASPFTFLGFLPAKGSSRTSALQNIVSTLHVVAFFEAPHRILKTVTELNDLGSGDRLCVCCREISKVHEEIWRGTVDEALDWLSGGEDSDHRIRGEFTVLLGPWIPKGPTKEQAKERITSYLEKLEADGVSRSEAVSIVSDRNSNGLDGWEFKRSEVYKIALKMNWKVKSR
jgi:16S rRNA (cytidine1402-2'-O)-methyltransferase